VPARAHSSDPELPTTCAVLLVLPDAIRQCLIPEIAGYLQARQLSPMAVTARPLEDDGCVETLYGSGMTSKSSLPGRLHGMEITRKLFGVDDGLAIVVACDTTGEDASRLLHDLKGPSPYLQVRAGSLYYIPRSRNVAS
jgi:hypothetical protein